MVSFIASLKELMGTVLPLATVEDFDRGEDVNILRTRYKEAALKDDPARIVVWAGSGVGLINKTQSAKVITTHRSLFDHPFIFLF